MNPAASTGRKSKRSSKRRKSPKTVWKEAYAASIACANEILPGCQTPGHPEYTACEQMVREYEKDNPAFLGNPDYPVLIASKVAQQIRRSEWESYELSLKMQALAADRLDDILKKDETFYALDRRYENAKAFLLESLPGCNELGHPDASAVRERVARMKKRNAQLFEIPEYPMLVAAAIIAERAKAAA